MTGPSPSQDAVASTQDAPINDASVDPTLIDLVDSPISPSSSFALSRFEFELGKGNEGTKVLFVEWDSSVIRMTAPASADGPGRLRSRTFQGQDKVDDDREWSIAWEGKTDHNVLTVNGAKSETDDNIRRVYFLLPPGAHIPSVVSITRNQTGSTSGGAVRDYGVLVLWTKPMPAIYPSSLGPGGVKFGKRGVLHTLWAKERLTNLMTEIEAEMKANSESIGLQIALQEQRWIAEQFGISEPGMLAENSSCLPSPEGLVARSVKASFPMGGKLGEKLRGLKLVTSPADLVPASQATLAHSADLSRALVPRIFGTCGSQTTTEPPAGVQHSLDAILRSNHGANAVATHHDAIGGEDELFALPLSPRSPEMSKSPFSLLYFEEGPACTGPLGLR